MTSMTSSIVVPWPNSWLPFVRVIRVWGADITSIFSGFNEISNLDFRARTFILADLVPFLMALVLLTVFRPASVILWYLFLLASISSFIIGAIFLSLSNNNSNILATTSSFSYSLAGKALMILGAVLVIILVSIYLVESYMRKLKLRNIKARMTLIKAEEILAAQEPVNNGNALVAKSKNVSHIVIKSEEMLAAELEISASNIDMDKIGHVSSHRAEHWSTSLKSFLVAASFIYIGSTLANLYSSSSNWYCTSGRCNGAGIPAIIGLILFIWGILKGLRFLLSLFRKGRELQYGAKSWINSNIGSISLTILWLLYIPITTTVFQTYTCLPGTCQVGYQFQPHSYQLDPFFLKQEYTGTKNASMCMSCNFDSTCAIATSLCPQVSDLRLNADPTLSCYNEMYRYYLPGALLMMAMITFGTPFLFHKLITITTKFVSKIPNMVGDEDPEFSWRLQMELSKNICRSLYYGFAYKWRYYNLILTLQKMLIVAFFSFMIYSSKMVIFGVASFIYLIFAVVAFVSFPYQTQLENILITTCFVLNAVNTVIALLLVLNVNVPEICIWPLLAANIGIPILIILYGIISVRKRNQEIKLYQKYDDTSVEILKGVDKNLNGHLVKYLVFFFQMIGLAAFCSMSLKVAGFILLSVQSNVYGATQTSLTSKLELSDFEFMGYQDWSQFTSNCCCQSTTLVTNSADLVYEQWKCLGNDYTKGALSFKLRKRVANGLSGYSMRPLCSTVFDPSVVCGSPVLNTNVNQVLPVLCNSTTTSFDITLW